MQKERFKDLNLGLISIHYLKSRASVSKSIAVILSWNIGCFLNSLIFLVKFPLELRKFLDFFRIEDCVTIYLGKFCLGILIKKIALWSASRAFAYKINPHFPSLELEFILNGSMRCLMRFLKFPSRKLDNFKVRGFWGSN